MSSRQLYSKGESDRLSLPAVTRKGRGKKSPNQPEVEQQQQDQLQQHATVQISPLPDQPPRPASTQLAAGESAAPVAGQAGKSRPTPPQDAGLMQLPPVNAVPPVRAGTPQVFLNNNTQGSGSHISQMSGPLFTEDRLSTSCGSDQEMCDQEVRNITQTHTPLETSTLVMSARPGSGTTKEIQINQHIHLYQD